MSGRFGRWRDQPSTLGSYQFRPNSRASATMIDTARSAPLYVMVMSFQPPETYPISGPVAQGDSSSPASPSAGHRSSSDATSPEMAEAGSL